MPFPSRIEPAVAFQQPGADCEMHGVLDLLSGPWTLHIVCSLAANGPMRFAELKRHVTGISSRLLTVRLRTLQARGFICRTASATVPPEVTYSPAPRLEEMRPVIKALRQLAVKWNEEDVQTAQ